MDIIVDVFQSGGIWPSLAHMWKSNVKTSLSWSAHWLKARQRWHHYQQLSYIYPLKTGLKYYNIFLKIRYPQKRVRLNTQKYTHTHLHPSTHTHVDYQCRWTYTEVMCEHTHNSGTPNSNTKKLRNWQGDKVERMTAEKKNKEDKRGRSRHVGVIFYHLFNQVLSLRSTFTLFRKTWESKSWPKSDKENSQK